MKKILFTCLLILKISSLTRTFLDRFTGCEEESGFFTNPINFTFLQITFQTACDTFVDCANSFNFNQDTCLTNFEKSQNDFCDGYTSFNLYRRRFCKKLVVQNMNLARAIDDDKFKNHKEIFKAQITDDAAAAECLNNALTGETCANGDAGQIFTFIRLDNDKFVIQNEDEDCIKGDLTAVECNFDDEEQHMEIEASGLSSALLKNNAGESLNVVTAAGFTSGVTVVGINVIS